MTTTLREITATKKPEPSAEEIAARELVRLAKEQGLSLTGPDGLLKQFTKSVLEPPRSPVDCARHHRWLTRLRSRCAGPTD